jgi:hypothetical protein
MRTSEQFLLYNKAIKKIACQARLHNVVVQLGKKGMAYMKISTCQYMKFSRCCDSLPVFKIRPFYRYRIINCQYGKLRLGLMKNKTLKIFALMPYGFCCISNTELAHKWSYGDPLYNQREKYTTKPCHQ